MILVMVLFLNSTTDMHISMETLKKISNPIYQSFNIVNSFVCDLSLNPKNPKDQNTNKNIKQYPNINKHRHFIPDSKREHKNSILDYHETDKVYNMSLCVTMRSNPVKRAKSATVIKIVLTKGLTSAFASITLIRSPKIERIRM